MNTYIIAKAVTSIGLALDAIGACFVAYEVVNQYKGIKLSSDDLTWDSIGTATEETIEYISWTKSKYKYMQIGIVLLIVGFLLQIFACWIPYFCKNNDKQNITNPAAHITAPIIQTKQIPNTQPVANKETPIKSETGNKTKQQRAGDAAHLKEAK